MMRFSELELKEKEGGVAVSRELAAGQRGEGDWEHSQACSKPAATALTEQPERNGKSCALSLSLSLLFLSYAVIPSLPLSFLSVLVSLSLFQAFFQSVSFSLLLLPSLSLTLHFALILICSLFLSFSCALSCFFFLFFFFLSFSPAPLLACFVVSSAVCLAQCAPPSLG